MTNDAENPGQIGVCPGAMKRVLSQFAFVAAVLAVAAPAMAETPQTARPRILDVEVPESSIVGREATLSNIIYLNRCKGGCTLQGGSINDSRSNATTIPGDNSSHILTEFNGDDTEWAAIVQCVKEMYSPYNVVITETDPGAVTFHQEAMVGGTPGEMNMSNDVGGVSPYAGCSPINSVINFTFANSYPKNSGRAQLLCGVIGQESAHGYGLDHEFDCSTPMTYLNYCGQSFFRNKNLKCGEFATRACRCGATQNSHASLTGTFGPGTPITGNPTAKVLSPANGASVSGSFIVGVDAADKRGIDRIELWLNGYKWAEYTEKRTPDKQVGTIVINAPANVPNGVIDVQVKAFNDIQLNTTSATVTVTKGAPCTSADSCATGQKCEAGKCFWDAPTGQLGDACDYPQFCVGGRCEDAGGGKSCTQTCFVGVAGTCPENFECVAAGAAGLCFAAAPAEGGGCCSVGQDTDATLLVNAGIGALFLGLVVGRRKRKQA